MECPIECHIEFLSEYMPNRMSLGGDHSKNVIFGCSSHPSTATPNASQEYYPMISSRYS